MVYELKNEIPSYEKFMRTYQDDSNLNYADLNIGDIETPKGYGPGLFGDIVKGVSAVALTASYFTPAVIVTGPLTVGAATWGVAVQAGGGDPEYGEAGKYVTDVATAAAVGATSAVLVPGASSGAGKVVKACCKHCPK